MKKITLEIPKTKVDFWNGLQRYYASIWDEEEAFSITNAVFELLFSNSNTDFHGLNLPWED